MRPFPVAVALIVWSSSGCLEATFGDESGRGIPPDTLSSPLREILLQPDASIQVVQPIGVFKESEEYLLVGDAFSHRVVRFDTLGTMVGSLGHSRASDGGVAGFGGLLAVMVEEALVRDFQTTEIVGFSLADGRETGRWPYRGRLSSMLAPDESTWILAAPDYDSGYALSVSSTYGSVEIADVLRIPPAYTEHEAVRSIFDIVSVAAAGDDLALVFSALDTLWLLSKTGARDPVATIVPVRFRRGTSAALEAFGQGAHESFASMFESLSVATAVAFLSGSRRAVVHFDQRIDSAQTITADVYVSIFDPATGIWCVDLVVPVHDLGRPEVGFSGDLMLVVDRVGLPESNAAATRYREFDLASVECVSKHQVGG